MIQTALIQDAHSDLVTDAAYDTYGLCLATCGLDQRIKVWALNEESGQWTLEDDWKAHDASITKVAWAHPAFGPIIASASFDRTVKIWEQVQGSSGHAADTQSNGAAYQGGSRWVERTVLLEARGSVRSIEFVPHHFGLKLATLSSDNCLRVYECLEQPALSTWQLIDEVNVTSLPLRTVRDPSSSSQTAFDAAGSTSAISTPTPGTHVAGVDGASVVNLLQQQVASGPQRTGGGIREADGGWSLSWCKERYWGEVLAVAAGTGSTIKLVQFSAHRRPQTILSLSSSSSSSSGPSGGSNSALARTPSQTGSQRAYAAAAAGDAGAGPTFSVTSVAWAPSCGRSYHLVAAGSRDGNVRVWKVRAPPPAPAASAAAGMQFGFDMGMGAAPVDAQDDDGNVPDEKWSASLVAEFDDHKSSVGRVEWNITGTILSSSGNDGRVRLWKQTVGGVWRPAGQISVEQEDQSRTQSGNDVDMEDESGAD